MAVVTKENQSEYIHPMPPSTQKLTFYIVGGKYRCALAMTNVSKTKINDRYKAECSDYRIKRELFIQYLKNISSQMKIERIIVTNAQFYPMIEREYKLLSLEPFKVQRLK